MSAKAALIGLRKLDKLIEQTYYDNCRGIEISVLDISKVFQAGRAAAMANGAEINLAAMTQAVIAKVQELRKN